MRKHSDDLKEYHGFIWKSAQKCSNTYSYSNIAAW